MSLGKLLVMAVIGGAAVYGGKYAYDKAQPGMAAAHRAEVAAQIKAGQAAYARAKLRDAEVMTAEDARQRAARNVELKAHPSQATPGEAANMALWGHFWDPTPQEAADREARFARAETTESAMNVIASSRPPEGGDVKAYNERIGQAYRAWAGAQRAAYGGDWRAQWEGRHGYARTAPSISNLLLPEG